MNTSGGVSARDAEAMARQDYIPWRSLHVKQSGFGLIGTEHPLYTCA
jgi:hypothetical protein